MAVVRKSESLADDQVVKVSDIKKPEEIKKNEPTDPQPTQKIKKKGFLRTTVEELRKVNWPSFKYTVTWAGIVIIFTFVMSITLGTVDHIFKSGMNYVDCTATYKTTDDADRDMKECAQETVDQLVFKND